MYVCTKNQPEPHHFLLGTSPIFNTFGAASDSYSLLLVKIVAEMSGPDIIVGLVFGALPLIFKAVEGYEKINDVIATYRKYSDEAARFSTELSTQKTIFHNECKLLLREVVDDQRLLHEIFSHPVSGGGPEHGTRQSLKNDENLDRKLFERINAGTNNSYKELVELLRLIDQDLQEIYEETKYFVDSRPSVSV